MAKTRSTRPSRAVTPASPPRTPTARAKKPRGKSTRKGSPPDLLIPRRRQGPPIKIVPRATRQPGDPEPFLQRFFNDPLILLEAIRARPAWVDDFIAIILISFGLISLLALLNSAPVTSTALSDLWADFLAQLFGRVGGALLALMVIAGGVLIVVPRLGVVIHMPWRRVLAIEVAYLALLALLHLLANDPEPRALARSGQGGGHVGWALGEILSRIFGSGLSVVLYLLLLGFALYAAFGIRRVQVRKHVAALSKRLEALAETLTQRAAAPSPAAPGLLQRLRERLDMLFSAGARRRQHAMPLSAEPVTEAPTPLHQTGPARAAPPPDAEESRPLAPAVPAEKEEPAPTPIAPQPPPLRKLAAAAPPKPGSESETDSARQAPRLRPALSGPSLADAQDGEPASRPLPLRPAASAARRQPAALGDEAADPAEPPIPAPITPSAAGITSISTPVSAPAGTRREQPALPEHPRRHFTVEDFQEARQLIPRPGLPPLDLLKDVELNKPTEEEINSNVRIIENTLLEFDIDVEVIDVRVGPTVTQYAVQPFREVTNEQGQTVTQRVRVNKIASLAGDLALALAAKRLRIQPYVPGRAYMGIEVPNRAPSTVALRPVMESAAFAEAFLRPDPDLPGQKREMPLTVPLGRDVSGESVIVDLATMPHLLIAGTTGSGKSVCITAMITALVMHNLPDRLKLILLDPKMVELSRFNGLPHLLGPVETDIERVIGVLRWATREMDRRFKLLEVEAARNIEIYNRALGRRRKADHLPYIVILIDEIGDLMLSRPEEMERTVTRLAQMARAVGMHLVVATQRPSTDVITGLIKANFPARISFAVASSIDSRVILDATGAETLVGRGDMLYLAPDAAVPRRMQGCYVSDAEIDDVVAYWKLWQIEHEASGDAPPLEIAPWERGITRRESLSDTDAMLEDAIDLVVREGQASTSLIQRRLGIAYPRAAQLMDLINELGILGATLEDGRTREVTMKPGTDPYKKLIAKYRRR